MKWQYVSRKRAFFYFGERSVRFSMASQSLINTIQGYENYIVENGVDEDVINAILYHTTGRPGMSLLEKIVYTEYMISEFQRKHIQSVRR